jgi:cellulose synthase/poly-beta-1,6-N-acetylglucosamine synthase-like glycosyltransferase
VASGSVDILMISYNRPEYTRLSLTRLLESCDENARVWLWHNGNDPATLDVVKSLSTHPRVHEFHHSQENLRLREPTNWFWARAKGDYLSKVDDDCLLPDGWIQTLRDVHAVNPKLGVIGCWRFLEEDFNPDLANKKIVELAGGYKLLRNLWVDDSGFLMKRQCVEAQGPLRENEWFDGRYSIRLSMAGWVIGWLYPFIMQEHMDDPRAPHTGLKSDADVLRSLPLTAQRNGIRTLAEWDGLMRRAARDLQASPIDLKYHTGWRLFLKKAAGRAKRAVGIKRQW